MTSGQWGKEGAEASRRLPFGRRDWRALGVLALLVLVFHGRPLVTGRVRVGSDLTDVRDPLRHIYVDALRHGRLALWAPTLNLGTPVFAESQLGQLHPVNLAIFSLLPVWEGGVVWLVIVCFAGGLFMYLFGREIGLGVPGRALASVVFMFSGFYQAHVIHLYALLLQGVHAPLALLLAERIATGRSRWAAWWAAVVFGLAVLAGHFQLTFQAVLLYAFYGAWRAIQEGRRWRVWAPRLAWLGLPLLVAVGLSAVQWMPTWELKRILGPGRDVWGRSSHAMSPPQIVGYVCPHLFRGAGNCFWDATRSNYWESLAYVGVLTLGLVGLAWGRRRTCLPVKPLAVAAMVFTVLSMGGWVPTHWLLAQLPGFGYFRAPGRYIFAVALCLAALAGVGLDRAVGEPGFRVRRRADAFLRFLIVALFAAFLVGLGEGAWEQAFQRIVDWPLEEVFSRVLVKWMVALPVAAVSWGAFSWLLAGRRHAVVLAVSVVAVDLLGFGFICERGLAHTARPQDLARPGPVVARLEAAGQAGRVFSMRNTWPVGTRLDLVGLPLENVSYDQISLIKMLKADPGPAIFRLYGIRFVLVGSPLDDPDLTGLYEGPDAQLAAQHGSSSPGRVFLYECSDPLRRAYLVDRARWFYTREGMARTVRHVRFDPSREVLIQGPVAPLPPPPADAPDTPGTCRIVVSEPTRVRVAVDAARAAWLVLNDVNYPGWTATLDGQPLPLPIRQANLAVRAVQVPAGRHVVTFDYRPRSFRDGLRMSLVTVALMILAAAGLFLAGRRPATAPRPS